MLNVRKIPELVDRSALNLTVRDKDNGFITIPRYDRQIGERGGIPLKKITAKSEQSVHVRSEPNNLAQDSVQSNCDVMNTKIVASADLSKFTNSIRQDRTNRNAPARYGTAGAQRGFSSEPLTAYKYDQGLARQEEVILTIKTTLQVDKNDRQEVHMKMPNAEVFGREAARPYVLGMVAAFSLVHDRFDWTLAESKWVFSAIEPYGVDASREKMALATAKSVQLIDMDTGEARLCHDPWLNQGHTVEFSSDGKKLLVGSSGFDAVFEFNTETGEVIWQWFAWDHGFDRSKLGHYIVRSAARQRELRSQGHEALLVEEPEKYEFGIPTRQKPAHLNGACYDTDGRILVTLFHQGAGYVVDRNTGEAKEVISGLFNPHKLSRRKDGGYFISDTRRGKLIFLDKEFCPRGEITLAGMPEVARSTYLSEYLQNTTELRQDLFASIDIHRSSIWLIDVKRRRYRGIKLPLEWSVHDVASLGSEHRLRIGSLVGTRFGKVAAFARQLKIIHHFSAAGQEVTAIALNQQGRRGI